MQDRESSSTLKLGCAPFLEPKVCRERVESRLFQRGVGCGLLRFDSPVAAGAAQRSGFQPFTAYKGGQRPCTSVMETVQAANPIMGTTPHRGKSDAGGHKSDNLHSGLPRHPIFGLTVSLAKAKRCPPAGRKSEVGRKRSNPVSDHRSSCCSGRASLLYILRVRMVRERESKDDRSLDDFCAVAAGSRSRARMPLSDGCVVAVQASGKKSFALLSPQNK